VKNFRSRIERIEKRVAIDEKPTMTVGELYHYSKLRDPEGFHRNAMDPHCP
jgi:hypothetical protein